VRKRPTNSKNELTGDKSQLLVSSALDNVQLGWVMQRRGLLVLMAFFTAAFWGCSGPTRDTQTSHTSRSSTPLEKLRSQHVIDAGYIVYPPAIVKDPTTGKLSGHFIDTMDAIAREAGATVRYHEVTWATFIPGLQAGTYDVTIAATYITIPRALEVGYTRPLFYLGSGAVVRATEDRFKQLSDLDNANVTIALTQGTGEHQFANRELSRAKKVVISSPDLSLAFLEVAAGRADAALNDAVAAREFVKRQPGTKVIFNDPPFNLTAVAWPVRQGDDAWIAFLNHSIDFLETTGQIRQFEAKYDAQWVHHPPQVP
jgi:polar amino acid transport system substrate-binding protein